MPHICKPLNIFSYSQANLKALVCNRCNSRRVWNCKKSGDLRNQQQRDIEHLINQVKISPTQTGVNRRESEETLSNYPAVLLSQYNHQAMKNPPKTSLVIYGINFFYSPIPKRNVNIPSMNASVWRAQGDETDIIHQCYLKIVLNIPKEYTKYI